MDLYRSVVMDRDGCPILWVGHHTCPYYPYTDVAPFTPYRYEDRSLS
jgi:hypothetical protein